MNWIDIKYFTETYKTEIKVFFWEKFEHKLGTLKAKHMLRRKTFIG